MFAISERNQKKLKGMAKGAYKALFSSIPPLAILFGALDGYQNARLEEIIDDLSRALEAIQKDKIDKDFVESEEFYDLFQKCCRIRLQHRSKLKAKFIVNLISESIQIDRNPRFDTPIKEVFLSILESMSDQEQIFLSDFAKGKYQNKSRQDVYKEEDSSNALALDALYTKGILKDEDTWRKFFELSRLGKEFIEYITILANKT